MKMLHGDNLDIEIIRNKLKSVSSCSELVREDTSQVLEQERFLKEEVKIEARGGACESNFYRKKVEEVLKRKIEMWPKKKYMRFRTLEKGRVLHAKNTNYFKELNGRVCQKVLQLSADRVFWKEDPPDLPRSLAGFQEIFSHRTVTSFKSPALAYPVHVVLLNVGKEDKKRLNPSGRGLVASL